MSRVIVRVFKADKLLIVVIVATLLACYQLYNATTGHLEARYIQTMSWLLAGKVIVIDPGHGGWDPGAIGSGGTREKEVTMDTSLRLAALLRQAGAQVILTRQDDEELSRHKREDLSKRAAIANENNADLFIGVHVNYFGGKREHGAQTFSQPGCEDSWLLNQVIQEELVRVLKNTNRASKQVDYYITRNVNAPSVIVEIGFISNPAEEKLMADPVYQDKIAWALYSGVVKYLAKKTTPTMGPLVDPDRPIIEQFSNPPVIPALKP